MSVDDIYSAGNDLFFGARKVWLTLSHNDLIAKERREIGNTCPHSPSSPRYSPPDWTLKSPSSRKPKLAQEVKK